MSDTALVIPWSAHLTLDDTLDRLRADDRVQAIAYLGSTGTDRWTEASDLDLLILLQDYPAGCGLEATIVDQRITDVVIVDSERATSLGGGTGSPDPSDVADDEWPYVNWLAQARPVHDPADAVAEIRRRAEALLRHRPPATGPSPEVYRSFLTHDLRVNAAMLRRLDDPITRAALGMRQLHTFVAAVGAWLGVRGVPNEGWKKNLSRLAGADPDAFVLVQQYLDTSDPEARHEIFERFLHRALEPVGGPLPEHTVLADPRHWWESLAG